MYFSIATQLINPVHIPQGKKVRKFCYNEKTDQLLVILSKKQWIVFDNVCKNKQKTQPSSFEQISRQENILKVNQLIFHKPSQKDQLMVCQNDQGQFTPNKEVKKSEKIQSKQALKSYLIDKQFNQIPLQLESHQNYFIWLSKGYNKIHFLAFQQSNFKQAQIQRVKYQLDSFQLQQSEFPVQRKFHIIGQTNLIIVNRGKQQNSMVIQQYQFVTGSSQKLFIYKGRSPKIPISNHKICRWISNRNFFVIFNQTLCDDNKLQIIRTEKQKEKVSFLGSKGFVIDSHDYQCISQQERETLVIINVHFVMDVIYLVMNTGCSTQVKQLNWKKGDNRFMLKGYLTSMTSQLGQTLLMLVHDRFEKGIQKFVVIGLKSFEIIDQYSVNLPIQMFYWAAGGYRILGKNGDYWVMHHLIAKQISYLKLLKSYVRNLSQNKGVLKKDSEFKDIQQEITQSKDRQPKDTEYLDFLYQHVMALL